MPFRLRKNPLSVRARIGLIALVAAESWYAFLGPALHVPRGIVVTAALGLSGVSVVFGILGVRDQRRAGGGRGSCA